MATRGSYPTCTGCHFSSTPGCNRCPYDVNKKKIHKFVGVRKVKEPQRRKWKETLHNKNRIIWEYCKYGFNLYYLTIEAQFDKILNLWIVYGTKNAKALPENPLEVVSKKEAISSIAMLKKRYERGGIPALINVYKRL